MCCMELHSTMGHESMMNAKSQMKTDLPKCKTSSWYKMLAIGQQSGSTKLHMKVLWHPNPCLSIECLNCIPQIKSYQVTVKMEGTQRYFITFCQWDKRLTQVWIELSRQLQSQDSQLHLKYKYFITAQGWWQLPAQINKQWRLKPRLDHTQAVVTGWLKLAI